MNETGTTHSLSAKFQQFSAFASQILGTSWSFLIACLLIVVWAISGPFFHFSDTWQLIINTSTTVITFLMVFIIQNTQNRDTRAINLKLNEIIRSIEKAHNELIDIEKADDADLERLSKAYERLNSFIKEPKKNNNIS
ncbi:low affinity iron permease family protein [Gloeobacter kilaueensis]|uniref:Small integral membrane protein n=1 Tax=Gloeobacter kilaueensis (strain ATCC BAA-2537 / CCAP 1431/1 / ULC 316 / JS1) TaxID=1183438 RepID=U5QFP3_GLOK1|nr:low affinity iron permease family protein [Gloeobacter kilaueensis]AGY57698.1 hypothetical protein GKIL_1452 [Gloeobacter kilaueensis JS1]